MVRKRKTFSSEFKAKVALEAVQGMKTISELAQEYQVHPNQIGQWKKNLVENSSELFDSNRGPKPEDQTELIDKLYRQIGMLQVENEWLKKSLNRSVSQLREIIKNKTSELSIQAQCSLIIRRGGCRGQAITTSRQKLLQSSCG